MELKIEVKLKAIGPGKGRGSVHIESEVGGITISNVLVIESHRKIAIKMPLIKIGDRLHPAVAFQGELKRELEAAVEASWQDCKRLSSTDIECSEQYDIL